MHSIRIQTERLLLRPLTVTDANDAFEWVSDERVTRYMNYTTYTDIEQVKKWLAFACQDTSTYNFGFERISDGKLIGSGDIRLNQQSGYWGFGYNLRYDCWGMGYATEAAKAMINYAYENFGARKFASSHCEPNLASGNVMKKCGLHFVGYGEFQKLDGSCKMRSMEYMRDDYIQETPMLDYSNTSIRQLIQVREWKELDTFECIKAIYNYVRDEIIFGYNIDDNIPASKVLSDGYGQCNTKGTLFMALLRACNIPCRVHGFTIDKKLQKGAMTGLVYKLAPQNVFHSWIEVLFENTWYELEAFILDKTYLTKLQLANSECVGAFCGYGVAVKDFKNPVIDFDRNNTYIQSEGINQDFGVYDCPDDLLREHHQEMSAVKAFIYRNIGRHLMNRNVKKIRSGK